MQIPSFLLRIMFSPVACLSVPYLSTWSHKRRDFRKKFLNINTVFSLYIFCQKHVPFWGEFRAISQMYGRCHVKYPLLLSDGNETNFLDAVLKNPHKTDINEIPSSGSRVVPFGQTDRRMGWRTDITKLIVASRNVAYAPNNRESHPRRPEPSVISSLTVFIFS